jgi:hypothetical protein
VASHYIGQFPGGEPACHAYFVSFDFPFALFLPPRIKTRAIFSNYMYNIQIHFHSLTKEQLTSLENNEGEKRTLNNLYTN